jgi:predicted phosphodiesterase
MSDVRDLLLNDEFLADLSNVNLTANTVANKYKTGKTFIIKHRKRLGIVRVTPQVAHGSSEFDGKTGYEESSDGSKAFWETRDRPVTFEDAREWLRASGDDPEDYNISVRAVVYDTVKFSNKMSAWPKYKGNNSSSELPKWPVIQPADPVTVSFPSPTENYARLDGYKLSLKCADPQIGFRQLADGTLDPFHDDKAMNLFVELCRRFSPDSIVILGDYLDLPMMGKFHQEATFAQTLQLALQRGHEFLAALRTACPLAEIVLIEGNHDKRMQNYIEANSLAAFGIKQVNAMPEDWPVMSLPHLMRLSDLDVQYIDAYPNAMHWSNDLTRNIHGTKANSKGSTMSQYVHELSHLNTWAGHTHRAEIVYRTVMGGRNVPIESYAANPGVLCRTDGGVPSVKGATGNDGTPSPVVEDWQAGWGMEYYNDTESWPFVYRIRNGSTIFDGKYLSINE